MNVLALDIGGTHCRIALINITNKPVIKKQKSVLHLETRRFVQCATVKKKNANAISRLKNRR